VAQTLLLLIFVIAFRRWCERTGKLIEQVTRNVEPVLGAARELMVETRERVALITGNINEISELAKGQMTRIDGFVKDTTERAQLQIVRLDQLVDETMTRVEETTEAIQRGVLAPVREISAITAGVRAGLEFLMRRRRKTVERATQDEELFI
jgi:methyl-accepting chemotaxis protein